MLILGLVCPMVGWLVGDRPPATALHNSSPPLFIFDKKQNDDEFQDVGSMEPITSTLVRTGRSTSFVASRYRQ